MAGALLDDAVSTLSDVIRPSDSRNPDDDQALTEEEGIAFEAPLIGDRFVEARPRPDPQGAAILEEVQLATLADPLPERALERAAAVAQALVPAHKGGVDPSKLTEETRLELKRFVAAHLQECEDPAERAIRARQRRVTEASKRYAEQTKRLAAKLWSEGLADLAIASIPGMPSTNTLRAWRGQMDGWVPPAGPRPLSERVEEISGLVERGLSDAQIAEILRCHRVSIWRIRRRHGL